MAARFDTKNNPASQVGISERRLASRQAETRISPPPIANDRYAHKAQVGVAGVVPRLRPAFNRRPSAGSSPAPRSRFWRETYSIRFSREDWAKILVLTATFTLIGALGIDYINSGRNVLRSIVVVGPLIAFIALGFWLFPSPKRIRVYLQAFQQRSYPEGLRSLSRAAEKHLLPRVIPLTHRGNRSPYALGLLKPRIGRPAVLKTSTSNGSLRKKKSNLPSLPDKTDPAGLDNGKQSSCKSELPQNPTHAAPSKPPHSASLKLWTDASPRLHINLFESNVPSFVLSADQHFVDWNVGFELAFAAPLGLKRGQHVSEWFDKLENFKRIAKRREQLYGEAILPLTDRERATFKHPAYGRMVYTKIMSPMIDLKSSKIIGWTIVLNINSVNRRKEFFEDLFRVIHEEGRRIRYHAAYPDVFEHYEGRRRLIEAHLEKHHPTSINDSHAKKGRQNPSMEKVLVWGPDSVALTSRYIQQGYRVTVFSDDVHLLRRVRSDYDGPDPALKLIRKESQQNLPEDYYHRASVMFDTGSMDRYRSILQDVYRSIQMNGIVTLSAITDAAGLERIFQASYDALQQRGYMDRMKHQFHHVRDFAMDQSRAPNHVVLDRLSLRELAIQAGFVITSESELHQEATTTLLVLQKR